MALDMTAYDDAMRIFYLPALRDNLNRQTVALKRTRRTSEDVEGRFAQVHLIKGDNHGSGARGDGGTLPTAGQQSYEAATFLIRHNYIRTEITGPTMRSTKTSKGAVAKALDSEMKGVMMALPKQINRQLFGDGTGVLAFPVQTLGNTTVATYTAANTTFIANSIQYLEIGQSIDILRAATGVTGGLALAISDIDESTQVITVPAGAADISIANNPAIYKAGNRGMEVQGFKALVNNTNPATYAGNFGAIDRTVAAGRFWNANVLSNSGTQRPLTTALLQRGWLLSDKKGGGKPTVLYSDHNMWATYGNLLVPDRRWNGLVEMDGGFESLKFNSTPWFYEKDCQPNLVYMLDETHIMILEQSDMDYMDEDGSILLRKADKDAYEFTVYYDCQLGADKGNVHVLVSDLIEAA